MVFVRYRWNTVCAQSPKPRTECRSVFHFLSNQHLWRETWLDEKWNTVCAQSAPTKARAYTLANATVHECNHAIGCVLQFTSPDERKTVFHISSNQCVCKVRRLDEKWNTVGRGVAGARAYTLAHSSVHRCKAISHHMHAFA